MSLTEQCSFADSKFLSHTDRLQRIMHEHQLSSSLYIRKMIKYKTLNYLNDTYEWSSSHGISGFLFIIIFLFRNRPLSNFLECMSALNSIVASHMHSNCKFGNCNNWGESPTLPQFGGSSSSSGMHYGAWCVVHCTYVHGTFPTVI
jgi:hypothetical protein